MEYLRIKLKPKSSIHLGEREGWLEGSKTHIPSDTLFSAFCHFHLLLYGEVDSFIEAFKEDPPFLLSSAFPYWGSEFYFPLPKNQIIGRLKGEEDAKELKRIKYVNLNLLNRLLNGEKVEELKDEIDMSHDLEYLPRKKQTDTKNGQKKDKAKERSVPWEVEDVPRVALSRFTSHPGENFFYFGQVYFVKEAGLFVLVKLHEESWKEKIMALFNLLADEGIGGDRTAGKGLFYPPEFDTITLPEIEKANALYAASTYFPGDNEVSDLENGFYELEMRKGYIFSPASKSYRRRSIRLFSEGSVFPGLGRKGKLKDITPEGFTTHRVYRYGYLLGFPCILERENESQN